MCGEGVVVIVCACSRLSACRVIARSIPVMMQKVRCGFMWRLALLFLTFCGRVCASCCVGGWEGTVKEPVFCQEQLIIIKNLQTRLKIQ